MKKYMSIYIYRGIYVCNYTYIYISLICVYIYFPYGFKYSVFPVQLGAKV